MNFLVRRYALALCLFSGSFCSWISSSTADDATQPSSEQITAAIKPYVAAHSLAGAVTLVADKDQVLSLDAVGFADIEAGKPMRKDAMFWIASQSKPITATALMILVDEGKVRLDDPVQKYLPEFKDLWLAVEQDKEHVLLKKPLEPVTLRNCLSHMSGMPFRSALEQPTLDGLYLRDAVRSYSITPLLWPPNTKYGYSNAGINTAGRIIEVVSGMKYEDFLDERLFKPLGMKDTTFWPNEEQISRLARPYKPTADKTNLEATTIVQLTYPLNDRRRQPMPGGGLFSTARDVGRFCQMILNGGQLDGRRYVSEDAVRQMTTRQTPPTVNVNYGLGWSLGEGKFDHGGALSTNMMVDTSRGLITVFLVQHAGFANDGDKSQNAFRSAAMKEFGKPIK
jgi:CubicO group peptidase (beta-lactamase class C family)